MRTRMYDIDLLYIYISSHIHIYIIDIYTFTQIVAKTQVLWVYPERSRNMFNVYITIIVIRFYK